MEVGTFLCILGIIKFCIMKRLFTYMAAFLILGSFTVSVGIDDIVAALRAGNSAQIAKFFDNTVEITLPDKSNSYSKNQAEVVLRDFFAIHPVKGFEILHKGENAGSQYCIGVLNTKTGSFRTTVYMKLKGEKQLLQEIRFENQ